MKTKNVSKAVFILSILAVLVILQNSYIGITGYGTADVAVKEKTHEKNEKGSPHIALLKIDAH